MGRIPSVSLPSYLSCRLGCTCWDDCYAHKLERLYPNVIDSYMNNWKILWENPEEYWKQVGEAVRKNRFFRFHVSGDIPTPQYFSCMVDIAVGYPDTEILCFTKQYEIVNDYVAEFGEIPENLHIIFSGWKGLEMVNPYNFPEAHVRFRDGYCDAREDAIECYGNCTDCSVAGCGCWKLKHGEQVVFNQH